MLNHTQVQLQSGTIHVVDTGSANDTAVLFLHGWPQDWSAWAKVLEIASEQVHALAIDLPGIGVSTMQDAPGSKVAIAKCVHDLVEAIHIKRLVLVGQDVGGMVAYSYLTQYPDEIEGAVIMNVAVPGVKPWAEVKRNPYIWHFTFHNVPKLPEAMVAGRQRVYFDYFYDILSAHPEKMTGEARDRYAHAYAAPEALKTGFEWYRTFAQDDKDNQQKAKGNRIETPLLYLRGEREGGEIEQYVAGFKESGIANVQAAKIADSGHYAADEQPEAVWKHIAAFVSGLVHSRG